MDRFIKFLTRYILIGLFVSILIVAAANVLEVTAMPAALQPADDFIRNNSVLGSTAELLRRNLLWGEWSDDEGSAPLPEPAADRTTPPVEPAIPAGGPSPDLTGAAPATSSDPASPLPNNAGAPRWGVVFASTAKAYTTAGKFLFRPSPGTVVKVSDIRETRSGKLAACYPLTGAHRDRAVLIPAADLNLQSVDLAEVPPAVRELRVREARILGKIDETRRNSGKKLREDTPHAAEYAAARSAYVEYWKKVKALQAERDSAEGSDHVRISDELRVMKGADIRLGQAYETAKRKYEDWNSSNPSVSNEESAMAALEDELSEVRARLEEADAGPR